MIAVDGVDPRLEPGARPACTSRLSCDLAALTLREFVVSLLATLVLLAVAAAGTAVLRRHPGRWPVRPLPFLSTLVLVAASAALVATSRVLWWPAVAVAVLVAGGWLASRRRWGAGLRALSATPGAALLAGTPEFGGLVPGALLVAMVPVVAVGAALTVDLDRVYRREGYAPVCLAVSVVAAYETVPDTDFVMVLLPAVVLLSLLAWPTPSWRLGDAATAGVVGLLMAAVMIGGRGRLSAVVGGYACLGLLYAEPLARRLRGRERLLAVRRSGPGGAVLVGLLQLAVVVVVTRVAGTRESVGSATLVAAAGLVVCTAALAVLGRAAPRDGRA